jgi:hypothetical protein
MDEIESPDQPKEMISTAFTRAIVADYLEIANEGWSK